MKVLILAFLLCFAATAGATDSGQALYAQKCAACHQLEGQGVPHPIPPLAGSPILLGDEGDLAALLLHGKAGMPAFHLYLDDKAIANILTYARDSWGNAAPPITEAMVAEQRQKLGRDGMRIPSN